MNNFNLTFYNAQTDLDNKYSTDIHIHRQQNGRRKLTILQGFTLSAEESKTFISSIKKKFGINGSIKKMTDIDADNNVYIFSGDFREQIKTILIEQYNVSEDCIKYHG